MNDYEEHLWDDFNYYMHTGELSEYFKEEDEDTEEVGEHSKNDIDSPK